MLTRVGGGALDRSHRGTACLDLVFGHTMSKTIYDIVCFYYILSYVFIISYAIYGVVKQVRHRMSNTNTYLRHCIRRKPTTSYTT
jgi:hypothetical protein